MVSRTLTILNASGFHARPAGLFVETAGRYRCGVTVRHGQAKADGKSILGLMLLGITGGAEIAIEAAGEDEAEALAALAGLVERRFDEA